MCFLWSLDKDGKLNMDAVTPWPNQE
jgi:hypothetical protein